MRTESKIHIYKTCVRPVLPATSRLELTLIEQKARFLFHWYKHMHGCKRSSLYRARRKTEECTSWEDPPRDGRIAEIRHRRTIKKLATE